MSEMLPTGLPAGGAILGGNGAFKEWCLAVVAILVCQLDYVWKELHPRNGRRTYERLLVLGMKWVNPRLAWTFGVGRHTALIQILRWEDAPSRSHLLWETYIGRDIGT